MNQRSSGSSTVQVSLALATLVIVSLAIGIAVHHFNGHGGRTSPASLKGGSQAATTVNHPTAHRSASLNDPQSHPPGDDWIGFQNGGRLVGQAGPVNAPPMHVRWTFDVEDDQPPDLVASAGNLRPDGPESPVSPAPAPHPTAHPFSTTRPVHPIRSVASSQPTTRAVARATTVPALHSNIISGYHADGRFEAAAAIVRGKVYVADTAGAVRALDVQTGRVIWTYHGEGGFEVTPLVMNGRLFLGDDGGMFYALSAETGRPVWKFDSGQPIHASANAVGPQDQNVVFGNDGADIFCMDATTGKQVWHQSAGDRVNGEASVAGGAVFVSGCDMELRVLKETDGSEIFTYDLEQVCPGSTAIDGDNLVCGTDDGRVLNISRKTQKQIWLFDKIEDHAMVYSTPAISDGIVVFGARDRRVYGLDLATGKQLWSYTTRNEVDSSAVISNGRVYIGSKDKNLYVLDLKTGNELWTFATSRQILASPAVGNGVVIIGDTGGQLFCLE